LFDQVQRAALLDHLTMGVTRVVAPETDRGGCAADPEIAQDDLGKPRGECWIEHEEVERRYRLQSEQRLHEERESSRVPELRRVGPRIRTRHRPMPPRDSADALRNAIAGI